MSRWGRTTGRKESQRCRAQESYNDLGKRALLGCLFPVSVRWVFEDIVMMMSLGQNREGPRISRITAIESKQVLAPGHNRTVFLRG